MYLQEINRRVKNNMYRSRAQFTRDLEQIVTNSELFNGEFHNVTLVRTSPSQPLLSLDLRPRSPSLLLTQAARNLLMEAQLRMRKHGDLADIEEEIRISELNAVIDRVLGNMSRMPESGCVFILSVLS